MEQVVEFLKGELIRVQNERDVACANERQLWNVISELKEQVGLLTTFANVSQEDGTTIDVYEELTDRLDKSKTRIISLMNVWAVAK